MAWDTRGRPGISGDRPGLAGSHWRCYTGEDQVGYKQNGGNGLKDIVKESKSTQHSQSVIIMLGYLM